MTPSPSSLSTSRASRQSGLVSTVIPTLLMSAVSASLFASAREGVLPPMRASRQPFTKTSWYSGGEAGKVPPMMMRSTLSTSWPMTLIC